MTEVVEHALRMAGGAMQVRADGIEDVYPVAEWIAHKQADGVHVYRRVITVIEDWEEVPRG
jgi:uncharacterized secreted protein with C-terminal beta-propeller domain